MKKTIKKAISVLLITVIVLCSAPLSGFVGLELPEIGGPGKLADSVSEFFADLTLKAKAVSTGTCGSNLTWSFNESTGTLTISGTGAMNSYSYSSVPWYSVCSDIIAVVLPQGITSIGSYAFYNCTSLESITIPDSVTSIGDYAFRHCYSLESITIPDSVTSIGNRAFQNCDSLASVTIGNSVTSIGYNAFCNCDSLTSITIPDGVTSIGSDAFAYCDSLASVTIGNSVTSIGSDAFQNCTSLASITIPDSVTSIGDSAFCDCDSLASVTIGNSVTSIGKYTFDSCNSLASVTIGNSVKSIGEYTFYNCQSLTSITIPDSVTSIGVNAFSYRTQILCNKESYAHTYAVENNLPFFLLDGSEEENTISGKVGTKLTWSIDRKTRTLTIDNNGTMVSFSSETAPWIQYETYIRSVKINFGCTNISDKAFYDCDYLESVEIPYSVTSIGKYTFDSCNSLASVTIPDSVTSIGDYAFFHCDSLASVTIPDSVTSIGDSAFNYCTSLASVTIGNSVTSIGDSAFNSCGSLTSVTIPDSVTSMGRSVFSGCSSLMSITIPDSVTSIGNSAFNNCTSLTSVTIPDSVTSIGASAFMNCTNLKSIKIPDGVTVLNSNLFSKCSALESITIGDSVTQIMNNAFYGCENLDEVRYIGDEESWSAITVNNGNDAFLNANLIFVPEPVTGICGDNLTWTYDLSTYELVISGTGDMYNWTSSSSLPWYDYSNLIETVMISEGVTSVGNWAFSDCDLISDVKIADSVKVIGEYAFNGCENLIELDLGNGVEVIERAAFFGCGITELFIPDSVTTIEQWAFKSSDKLEMIYIGKGLKNIVPWNSFDNYCFNVSSLNTAFSSDEYGVLYNKSKTTLLMFPSASKRTGYVIPEGVKSIGILAFFFCETLESITVPDSVINIDQNAVKSCEKFKEIYYLGTKSQWDSITVAENNNEQIKSAAVFCCTDATDYLTYTVDETGNATITDCDTSIKGFVSVPSTIDGHPVTAIGNSAFSGCNSIKKIILPEGVVSLGIGVFMNCNLISEITLPESLETIGNGVFRNCSSLRNIDIPEGVTSIGSVVFNGCTSLKSVRISDNASIGPSAFQGCSALAEVTLGNNLTSIPSNLFRDCSSLETIIIPDGVTNVGPYAFINCTSLNNIIVPATVTVISANAFSGCTGLTDVYYRGNEGNWNAININSTNNSSIINATIHYNLRAVTWNSDGRKTVDYYEVGETIVPALSPRKSGCTFVGWDNEIPSFMPENDLVFNALWEPDSFTVSFDAADGTFGSESVIQYTVAFGSNIPVPQNPVKENYTFIGWNENIPETMPDRDLVFTAVFEFVNGSIGENVSFEFDKETGILTVMGTGEISSAPWFGEKEKITSVVISEGITSIPDNAFDGCSNLTEVFLPASLVSIGDSVFTNCERLNNVYYADGEAEWNAVTVGVGNDSLAAADMHFTYLPEEIFNYKISNGEATITGYNSGIIKDGIFEIPSVLENCPVTAIGARAFYGKTEIVSVIIPSTVMSISETAFSDCSSLVSVAVSENNTAFSGDANGVLFNKDKTELILYPVGKTETDYVVPNGVVSINNSAFKKAKNLVNVTVSEGVTSIGTTAFAVCSSLETITLPVSLTNISNGAFNTCSALTDVYYNGYQKTWDVINIGTGNDSLTSATFHCEIAPELIFSYTVYDSGYVEISGCNEAALKDGVLNIPSMIEDCPVTKIKRYAFSDCETIKEVIIPDTMTYIDEDAFLGTDIESVYYTGNLAGWFDIVFGPYSYYSIYTSNPIYSAENFYVDGVLIEGELVIPDSVDIISHNALYGYDKITSLVIPDSVTSIGKYAFNDCDGLTNVTIGSNVTSIGDNAFYDCDNLCGVVFPDSVETIGSHAFYSCDKLTDITLGNGVTSIGTWSFYNCDNLGSVVFPDSVETIGSHAFYSCDKLTDITLGNSVTSIGDSAFYDCYNLGSVVFPDSVETIGEGAFYSCDKLTDITLGNSVTSIGSYAFSYCSNLADVIIPDSVTSIGRCAFSSCSRLASVTIGSGVSAIGERVFSSCTSLQEITVDTDNQYYLSDDGVLFNKDKTVLIQYPEIKSGSEYIIPESVTEIYADAFNGNNFINNITIPESLTSVGMDAFYSSAVINVYYRGTIESWCEIVFGDSESNPMCRAKNLYISGTLLEGDITIPESVTSVGDYAFYNCDRITGVTIHDGVTNIGDYAFNSCSSLERITLPDIKLSIGRLAFNSTPYYTENIVDDSLYVGKHLVYAEHDSSESFEVRDGTITIAERAFAYSTPNSVVLPSSIEYIGEYGFGNVYSLYYIFFNGTRSQWAEVECVTDYYNAVVYFDYSEEKVSDGFVYYINSEGNAVIIAAEIINSDGVMEIPSEIGGCTVTEIADKAFYNKPIRELTIPDTVEYIGKEAFAQIYNLEKITFSNSVSCIDKDAFENCYNLDDIYYNGNLSDWCEITFCDAESNPAAIDGYTNLYINGELLSGEVVIPDGTTAIGDYAFYNNRNIKNVNIPDSLTSVGNYAFYDCYYLRNLTIGNSVTKIGYLAFAECDSLSTVTLPDSVTNIGEALFEGCRYLKSVTIGKGLENFVSNTFDECDNLSEIIVSEDNPYLASVDGVLFSKDKKILAIYPQAKTNTTFEIPAETETFFVKNITYATHLESITVNNENPYFTSVDGVLMSKDGTLLVAYPSGRKNGVYKIPDTVTTIDSKAFYIRDDGLRQIGIPKSVTRFNENAFSFYRSLSRTYYGGTEEEWKALVQDNYSDYSFGNVNYNNGMKTDDSGLVYSVNENSEAILIGYSEEPEGLLVVPSQINGYPVVSIGEDAFVNCEKITELVVSEGVREIGDQAFETCDGLEKVTLPDSLVRIGSSVFENCGNLKEVRLSQNLEEISSSAFYYCLALTEISFPDSLEVIGYNAFRGCHSLKEISIPDSVTNVEEYAFSDCYAQKIKIGSGLTRIYDNAFSNNSSLVSYEVSPDNPAYSTDEHGVLFNKDKTKLLVYPRGRTEESYEIPASVTEVVTYALQYSKNLKSITVNAGNEHYASDGSVLFSKDYKTLVCLSQGTVDCIYVVPDTVTTIATGAIVTDDEFDYISIPETVTTFCQGAVSTPYSFRAIFFGGTQEEWNALKSQNEYNYSGYIYYSEIYFNSSADKDHSSGLTYIIDENSKATVISADETVKGDFVIPDTLGGYPVIGIGDEVFEMNSELTGITIPDTVTVIGDSAFWLCVNLEEIVLPPSLEIIEDEAFYCCVKLEKVDIPANVTDIGFNAFVDCINIKEFTISEDNEQFTADENGVLYSADKTYLIQYPLNSSVTDYVIPDTVKFINFNGFIDARNLKTLRIPASASDFEISNAFLLGMNFERFIVDENNQVLSSDEQGALYSKNKEEIYCVPPAIQNKNFVVPDSVRYIYDFAFLFCKDMVITLPDSVDVSDWAMFGSAKELIVSETNPYFAAHKGALYNKDKTILIKYPTDSDADIHVAPETLELVYEFAFLNMDFQAVEGCKGLMFIDGFDVTDLFSIGDNVVLHAPVPVFTFGLKQVCVSDPNADDLQRADENLADFFEEIRYMYENLDSYQKNESISLIEKFFCENLIKIYGAILSSTDHITVCGGEHSDVHTHNWVETVVDETCTVDGSITVACSICDEATVTIIPACHKPGEWVTVIEPTTKAEGKKEKYCTVCEEMLEEEILPKLDIPVTGINLIESDVEIVNYTSVQLNAATVPTDCNNPKILWSSSDESIATVDEKGIVTAVSVGNAIITATTEDGGFTAECVVTVAPAEFTVTLNIDGVQSALKFKEGEHISIETPVKEGYSFIEWVPEIPAVMPSENIEFTAVFGINTYTVEWNIDGLTLHESYQYGGNIDKSKTFTKKGYTFAGWTPEIPDTMPANNLVFNATWTANVYDAVFFTNGGSFPDGDSIKRIPTAYNSEISVPENPVKSGYEFMGWAYKGKNIGMNAGIMDSIDGKEFEAIWASNNTARYRIETYTMNTVGDYDKISITLNGNIYDTVSLTPDAETGFVLNEEKSVLEGTVGADNSLVLKVYYDRLSYNFNMVVDGRTETVSYYYGAMISEPAIPVKEGCEFVGWNKEIPATMPAEDITVTAVFKEKSEDKTYAKLTIATPEKRTLYYGETITLYASTKNLPEGAKIKWYVDGDGVSIKPSANGKSCKVTSTSNGNVVIRAMVVDAKGNTVKGSDGKPVADYETIYSEVTFWQVIVNFLRSLFGKTASASTVLKVYFK